jgi:uncharacterized paraquat-inducible protein A
MPNRPSPSVTIAWNALSSTHTARCSRCGESVTAHRYTWAATWAERHACDGELIALLAAVEGRAA